MMNEIMRQRLEAMKQRDTEISNLMSDPQVLSDNKQLIALSKEQASLSGAVHTYEEVLQLEDHYAQAEDLAQSADPELRDMALDEVREIHEKIERLLAHLEIQLIPKDPDDELDAIVEIRGAAGGDEGNIFAGDLYRMYSRYAEEQGFRIEVMESSEAEAGGYTLISFLVKGPEAYHHFKFESGAHRVQRVPKTETQGRIHTSTATVLVLPDVETDMQEINPADLVIDTHRASGAGGQHINKTDSAVRITHIPTGISVNCQDGRSQHDNRDKAMRLIRARVHEALRQKQEAEQGVIRRSKIGRGDRSEKIRTYNYPQNRVTDHRIGLTIQQLDRIMEGHLDDIIEALWTQEQKEKLAGDQVEL